MDIETFRDYCLSKRGVTEALPFDEHTLVFKVMGKMFALTSLAAEIFSVNLKCDPERAIELRTLHEAVKPGYHMNKKHWNTVVFDDGTFSTETLRQMIDHSYDLVVSGLTKSNKELLKTNKKL